MTGLQTLHSDPPQPNRDGAASAVPVREVFPNLITSAELARKAVTAGADFAVVGTKSEAAHEFFFRRDALKEQFGKEPNKVSCLAVKSALLGTRHPRKEKESALQHGIGKPAFPSC